MPLLNVANSVYDYPSEGSPAGWGTDASAWAVAVTSVLNTLLAPGDLLETPAPIADNITSPTNINALSFDAAVTRAANVDYSIYRSLSSSSVVESGTIYLTYDANRSSGSKWSMSQIKHSGDAGLVFTIGDDGQIQYISSSLGYGGTIHFRAKTLGV